MIELIFNCSCGKKFGTHPENVGMPFTCPKCGRKGHIERSGRYRLSAPEHVLCRDSGARITLVTDLISTRNQQCMRLLTDLYFSRLRTVRDILKTSESATKHFCDLRLTQQTDKASDVSSGPYFAPEFRSSQRGRDTTPVPDRKARQFLFCLLPYLMQATFLDFLNQGSYFETIVRKVKHAIFIDDYGDLQNSKAVAEIRKFIRARAAALPEFQESRIVRDALQVMCNEIYPEETCHLEEFIATGATGVKGPQSLWSIADFLNVRHRIQHPDPELYFALLSHFFLMPSKPTESVNPNSRAERGQDRQGKLFTGNDACEKVSGAEFEQFVATLLRLSGWAGTLTKMSGDQGVDVIAELNGVKVAIQCKRYSGSVGNAAVQEVFAGRTFYGTHAAVVVTNAGFTSSAVALAATLDVKLCHYNDLISVLNQIYSDA